MLSLSTERRTNGGGNEYGRCSQHGAQEGSTCETTCTEQKHVHVYCCNGGKNGKDGRCLDKTSKKYKKYNPRCVTSTSSSTGTGAYAAMMPSTPLQYGFASLPVSAK